MEDEEDGAVQAWPLIIENASHMMKVGFASENAPRAVFPCMVGHLKHHITFCNFKDDCVGDEAYYKRGCLNLNYPIDRGIIKDWDGMIKIWHHIFHTELRVDPKEHPVLLTEPPLNPKANREKMTQIMFETFNVPALYIANKAVLSLFESGRMTGLVLDCGEHVSQAVPIYEGHALPHAVLRLDVGGRQIFESFNKKCCELHYDINCTIEKDMLKPVKENLMYVAYDYEQELVTALNSSCMEKWYMLPTGEHIIIRCQERFEQPEALFRPSLLEMDEPGIHEMVYNSIMKCDEDLRKEMYANIILCGGSSLFPGLQRRLIKEIEKLAPTGTTINLVAAPERKYSTWIGGSIVASLPIFQSWWITKEEYELYGASIVHRKCI